MCETWTRWYAAAARTGPGAMRRPVMAGVPKRIQRAIREVTDVVAALHHTSWTIYSNVNQGGS